MLVESLDLTAAQFESLTGWQIKPEGACKGDVCVPLEPTPTFHATQVMERLGMAVVTDQTAGLLAVGPGSVGGRALVTAEAPELVLDDLDGNSFRLSTLRGEKVLLVAWAPY